MPTLKLPLHTRGERPRRRTSARIDPNALPNRVTPRSTTNPLTRSVVILPPTRASASSTSGSSPRSFNRTAAPSPAIPPPMTITSASPLWVAIAISLSARPGKKIHGLVGARVLHIVKTFMQELVPILAFGYVMNHRSENHVVVCVPTVFEQKYFSVGLQGAGSFAEEFFSRTTRGDFVSAEPKTNRVGR